MSPHSRLFGTLALLLSCLPGAAAAGPGPIEIVQSDARGVTLRLEVKDFQVVPGQGGLSAVHARLGGVTRQPGRPALPFAAATLALPPAARAQTRIVESAPEEAHADVALAPNGRPGFRGDPASGDRIPVIEPVEPIRDGPWPPVPLELGQVYTLRRQRLVTVRIQPFRYDEVARRLTVRRSLTVRVDFVGGRPEQGVPSTDTHWDPVLRGSVLNFDQATRWRERPATLRPAPLGRPAEARGRRATPLHGAGVAAFDETNPEVRIQTDTSGVYAFPYDDLAGKGFPAGIPVDQVSVHRHEFIEGANPPYVTVEIPIEVDDANGNGVFDAGDRIVTFIQSWAARARASVSQRAWGDGEVLYATYITDRPPLRLPTRPGWRNLSLTPLQSYPFSERFEQNLDFTLVPPDTNSDQFLWTGNVAYARPDSFPFETNDLDTTRSSQVTVSWTGKASEVHTVWAHVRNGRRQFTTVVDSLRWNGFADFTHTATLFGSALTNGPSNVLRTWGKLNDANLFTNAGVNWFEVDYWRYYLALEGLLSCNGGGAAGAYQIRAEGFGSGALRVYDVTDSLNPVRLDVDPSHVEFDGATYAISFQDSSGGERRQYVVFDQPKLLAPDRIRAVTRRNLAGGPRADYLVVVPEAWLDVASTLADFRRSQGYSVLVAPLESVNDEFNGGRRSAYALRRFFQYADDAWSAEFAVLLGDGSLDPQNLLGNSGVDYIPAMKLPGPVSSGIGLETVVSDDWLVSFGRDQLNNNLIPVPDLFIGRIPADSHDDLKAVVNKIIKYETVTPDQQWRRNVLLLADDNFSTGGFGNFQVSDYCAKNYEMVFLWLSDSSQVVIQDYAGLKLMNVEVFAAKDYLTNAPTVINGNDTCRVSWPDTQRLGHAVVTPLILDRLNQGRLWWNYQGHANPYVLAHEDLYVNRGVNDDKDMLTNVDRPFLFSAFSCHANAFGAMREARDNQGPSLGEDMVMLPDRGAVASWASTGFEVLPTSSEDHLNTRLARSLFSDPPRDTLGDNGARVVLGQAIAQTLAINYKFESGVEGLVGWTYTLLGDPATRLSIGAAQMIVTANGVPVTSGEPVRLLSSGDTLRIEADIVSNVELKALSLEFNDIAGAHVIPPADYTVTPAFPDTGAAGQGGRRFHLTYRTTLTAASYRYVLRTTDRNGVPAEFEIVFELKTVLRANGAPLRLDDPVRSDAALSVLALSPSPIQPATDMELLLNDAPLTFAPTPVTGDTSRREWVLSWQHAPYAAGRYELKVRLNGQQVGLHRFTVSDVARLDNLMAFPNPFDDELGTRFTFTFAGAQPFDMLLRVFTVSGRMIYEHVERGLDPGYHQIPWDGRDAEGQKIANGIYLYKLVVKSGSGNVIRQGSLVKLRKPHHVDVTDETGTPP